MRLVRSLFAILAAVFATAVAWEAQAQQLDPYVSCVRCHALPMPRARAEMLGHGYGYPPEPEMVCAGCHDTWRHEQDPNSPSPTPYFLFPGGLPGSFMRNACIGCHADHTTGTFIHADDVFPYFDTTPPTNPPLLPPAPTSVLPLFNPAGMQDQFGGGLVCSTCHNAHAPSYPVNGASKFLRIGSTEQTAALCDYCHDRGSAPTTGSDLYIPSNSDSVRFELQPTGTLRIDVTVRNRGNAYPTSPNADVFWEDEFGYRMLVGPLSLFSIPPEGEAVIPVFWMPPPDWAPAEGFFVFTFPPRPLVEGYYPVEFVRSINVPPAPTNVRVTSATPSEIRLEWDPPSSPPADLGWDVYRDGVKVTPIPAYSPGFVDGGLAPATPHVYQVVAVSLSGGLSSQPSDPVGGTTAGTGAAIIKVPEQYPTIQQAIAAAYYGTIIQVAPGTYTETLNFGTKYGITVKGQDANGCILDYTGAVPSGPDVDLGFRPSGQPGNTLAGFTVRNGWIHMTAGDVLTECIIVAADTVQAPMAVSGGGLVAQCLFETTTQNAFHIEPDQFLTSVNSVYLVWQPFAGYLPPADTTLLLNNDFPYWPEWVNYDGSGNFGDFPLFASPGPPQEYLPDPGSPTVGRGLPLDLYGPAPNVGAFQPWQPYTPQPPSGLAATVVQAPQMPARVRLTWTASIDDPARMFQYFVYRSESPTFPPSTPSNWHASVSAGQFSFEDQNIAPGITYYYQVRGYAGPGPEGTELLSAPTNTASATLLNSPPVAVDDAATTRQGRAVTIPVLANDSDPEGDVFHILDVGYPQSPQNGTANMNADQTIEYTPYPGFFGTDSFSYTVMDDWGGIATATVTVTVTPDYPPIATDDAYTVAEDGVLSVTSANGVLANDTDPDGDTLEALLVASPTHGTLTLNLDGSFVYTPAASYSGPDSFTYFAGDLLIASAPATVTITVTPVNHPPVAADQTVTTAEDAALVVTLAATDADSDPLTYTVTTSPAHGTVSGTAPKLTYTPAADFNGADSFTFTASDGRSTSAPATIAITVTPVNDPPVARDDTAATAAHVPVLIAVLGNDTDADGDALSVSSATPGANGGTAVQPDGRILYTPNPGFTGADSFSYVVDDGHGGTDTAAVTVSVRPQRLRITALTMATVTVNRLTNATATALAVDEAGAPVAGVSVGGRWSELTGAVIPPDIDTAVTGADGRATVSSSQVRNANGTFTFTIDTAVKAGYELDGPPASVLSNAIQYPAPPPPGGEMHVASIVMGLKNGRNTSATATVTVVDANGVPVASASVSGSWSDAVGGTPTEATRTTGTDGKVTFSSAGVKIPEGETFTFTFAVTEIAKSGWTYDSAANVDTEDSITAP